MDRPTLNEVQLFALGGNNAETLAVCTMVARTGMTADAARKSIAQAVAMIRGVPDAEPLPYVVGES